MGVSVLEGNPTRAGSQRARLCRLPVSSSNIGEAAASGLLSQGMLELGEF